MAMGNRTPRGMKPTVENPGQILKRLIKFTFDHYGVHMIIVFVCIVISVLANLQGTMFMKSLIDDYIDPMVEVVKNGELADADFGPLLHAIIKTAIFYGIGVIATFTYNRIMVNVSQGSLRRIRDDMFNHMQSLPIS